MFFTFLYVFVTFVYFLVSWYRLLLPLMMSAALHSITALPIFFHKCSDHLQCYQENSSSYTLSVMDMLLLYASASVTPPTNHKMFSVKDCQPKYKKIKS